MFETSFSHIGKFNDYHIWIKKHVPGYFNTKDSNIWLLRAYKLKEPLFLTRTRGMVFANVDQKVGLDYKDPIMGDKDFKNLKEEILNT